MPIGRLFSLTETCKLNGIDQHAWLTTALTAIAAGHMQSRVEEILPWNHAGKV